MSLELRDQEDPQSAWAVAQAFRRSLTAWLLGVWDTPVHRVRPEIALPFLRLGSRIYAWGLRRDQARSISRRRALPAFVISVGNLTTGGTGKTPFTLWLSAYLASRGRSHAILSRGFGRRGSRTARVPSGGETCSQVRSFGDEPVLLSRNAPHTPVWVGRDRWISGRAALSESQPGTLILDDGFQHLILARNLDLVLLDAHSPFGNGSLLPLGPLREPVTHLARADAFVLTRAQDLEKVDGTRSRLRSLFPGKPVFSCRHRLTRFSNGPANRSPGLECLWGKRVAAFAGLGNNAAFFRDLRELGIDVVEEIHFPDHHLYGRRDMECIFRLSSKKRAHVLATTEKDWVRLPRTVQGAVLPVGLQLDFGDEYESLCRYLDVRLAVHVCPSLKGNV